MLAEWLGEEWRSWLIFLATLLVVIVVTGVTRARKKKRSGTAPKPAPDPKKKEAAPKKTREARREKAPRKPRTAAPPSGSLDFAAVESITLGSFPRRLRIERPLSYIYPVDGDPGADYPRDPAEIHPELPIRRPSPKEPPPPWPKVPSYDRLNPEQRWLYLEWLSRGRAELPDDLGLLRLFLYGLERRSLHDQLDTILVSRELLRLTVLLDSHSGRGGPALRRHLTQWLWSLSARHPQDFSLEEIASLHEITPEWTDELIGLALTWFGSCREPMPLWMATTVAETHPDSRRSVTLRHARPQFDTLFAALYEDRHGEGMRLAIAKRPRKFDYKPLHPSLPPTTATLPNPMGLPSQFKTLGQLWNECGDRLRRYALLLQKEPSLGQTSDLEDPALWNALPPELRRKTPHPSRSELKDLLPEAETRAPRILEVRTLVRLLLGSDVLKLTLRTSKNLAEILEDLEVWVEPDPRLTGRSLPLDSRVAVFPSLPGTPSAADSKRNRTTSLLLRLGLSIALADRSPHREEVRLLTDHIERSLSLGEEECLRLEARSALLAEEGERSRLRLPRLRDDLPDKERKAVARLLVAIAAYDQEVTPEEKKALERAFATLGLSPDALEEQLAELHGAPPSESEARKATEKAPVPDPSLPEPGPDPEQSPDLAPPGSEALDANSEDSTETIREKPAPAPVFQLDRSAIAEIMSQTTEVTRVISEALEGEEEEGELPRLPESVARFFGTLKERDRWPLEEAEELARNHDQMLSGALEIVNEWSFEAFGGPVVFEDGDSVAVDRELLPRSGREDPKE